MSFFLENDPDSWLCFVALVRVLLLNAGRSWQASRVGMRNDHDRRQNEQDEDGWRRV